MMRVCNLDTCPVGIATQNPALCGKFAGKPEYIENLMRFLAREVREWMARIGVRRFQDLVGHVELLRQNPSAINDKARTVDLSRLLYQPKAVDSAGERRFSRPQDHALERTLDKSALLSLCRSAIERRGARVSYRLPVNNRNRTIGCMLSGEITRRHGAEGLPDGSIRLRFDGSAGQSFGAFLARGVELALYGDSNDHVGKGLSGGRIIVTPPEDASFDPGENIIIGNVALYGATAGEAYIRGVAGERFCVRNSGATAVVEGVGDHGCEYMTGGRALILGAAGRNFAAGMSGGVAYVWDAAGDFSQNCNLSMVEIAPLEKADKRQIRELLEKHLLYTGSDRARTLLDGFPAAASSFVKVVPRELPADTRADL
jgi:glutamate synthase (ferredoxin)